MPNYPCPFCGKEMKHATYSGEWGIEEEYADCTHCNLYHFLYSYGATEELVGFATFAWYYTITTSSMRRMQNLIDATIARVKKHWRWYALALKIYLIYNHIEMTIRRTFHLWPDPLRHPKRNC